MIEKQQELDIERFIGATESRLTNLEDWQKMQNGSLQRISSRIDKIMWVLMALAFSCAGSLGMMVLQYKSLSQVQPHTHPAAIERPAESR